MQTKHTLGQANMNIPTNITINGQNFSFLSTVISICPDDKKLSVLLKGTGKVWKASQSDFLKIGDLSVSNIQDYLIVKMGNDAQAWIDSL
jgi:hypothetical protein